MWYTFRITKGVSRSEQQRTVYHRFPTRCMFVSQEGRNRKFHSKVGHPQVSSSPLHQEVHQVKFTIPHALFPQLVMLLPSTKDLCQSQGHRWYNKTGVIFDPFTNQMVNMETARWEKACWVSIALH